MCGVICYEITILCFLCRQACSARTLSKSCTLEGMSYLNFDICNFSSSVKLHRHVLLCSEIFINMYQLLVNVNTHNGHTELQGKINWSSS